MTRTRRGLAFAAVLACCGACAGAATGTPAGGAAPIRGQSFRLDDRVVIPSMTMVRAVAVSDRYAFLATPLALGIYDRVFSQWLPPFTRIDGWPLAAVNAMMADPADSRSVWVATNDGVFHYRAGDDQIAHAMAGQPVAANIYVDGADPAAGLIVQSASGVYRVSPTGFTQPYTGPTSSVRPPARPVTARARYTPQTVASVYAQFHSLQDYERLLTRDESMRAWPVIAAGVAPAQNEVWLGTAGGGAFKVDPVFNRGEAEPFGMLGDGATAVAAGPGGVWIGGSGRIGGGRDGLTYADNEMRHWRWIDGGVASPFAGVRITAISAVGRSVWVGTDHGLVRVDAQTGAIAQRWDDTRGLPSAVVLAVAAAADGAWVATTHGVVFVHETAIGKGDTGVDAPVLENFPAQALLLRRDTLWIGSNAGVLVLPPGSPTPRQLRVADREQRVSQSVVALASADSIVAFATAGGEVLRVNARTGDLQDTLSIVNPARAGRIHALAMDGSTVWIAGDAGVVIANRATRAERFLPAFGELPGEAFGVALTPAYAWIAARDGVVRLRRLDDGSVR